MTSADGSWCTETMLILVRHGESTGNQAGLLAGRIDLPLTERGIDQAKAVGAALQGVTRVVSSPLGRARATAEALGFGLPIEVDERWIEVDYGSFDGRPLADVPAELWREWRSDPHFRPPGGRRWRKWGPGWPGPARSSSPSTVGGPGATAMWWW